MIGHGEWGDIGKIAYKFANIANFFSTAPRQPMLCYQRVDSIEAIFLLVSYGSTGVYPPVRVAALARHWLGQAYETDVPTPSTTTWRTAIRFAPFEPLSGWSHDR